MSSEEVAPPPQPSRKGLGTALAIAAGITLPFIPFFVVPWLPRKIFGALPWLATSPARVNKMLDFIPASLVGPGRRFIDLGSGDGVAVIEAAKRGMVGVGVELNPTLVLLSKLNARRANVSDKCTFVLGDLWTTPLGGYDVVMVFGVVPMMPRLVNKLGAELQAGKYVCSHKFPLPGLDGSLQGVVNDIYVYRWAGNQNADFNHTGALR